MPCGGRAHFVCGRQGTHGVKTLGVVGAGQMGGGIAQVASQVAGVRVVLVDSQQAQLERALQTMGACEWHPAVRRLDGNT